jgi:hypothetical protein
MAGGRESTVSTKGRHCRCRSRVETGAQRRRAEGPYVTPSGNAWDCMTLDLDSPASSELGYDAIDVVGIGVDIDSGANARAEFDHIAY